MIKFTPEPAIKPVKNSDSPKKQAPQTMTEREIQRRLYLAYIEPMKRYDFALPNCYIKHDNECDVIAIRKSGFYDEFEIKISRSDFLADARKTVYVPNPEYIQSDKRTDEHRRIMQRTRDWGTLDFFMSSIKRPKSEALTNGHLSNFFWYVAPQGLIALSELPSYAGLIEILPSGARKLIKSAPKLHNKKLSFEERYKIARKATFRVWRR